MIRGKPGDGRSSSLPGDTGCHGTGEFEGMRMRAWISNEADPGTGGDTVYDLWGEIW
jgi:hypothetical protein